MKKAPVFLLFTLIPALLLQSCSDKLDSLKEDWNPTLALPLINTNLGIYNIFAPKDSNDIVIKDPSTGLLALVYQSDLLSVSANEFVPLPDQPFLHTLSLTPSENNQLTNAGTVNKVAYTEHDYLPTINQVQIDSLRLEQGKVKITIANTYPYGGTLVINIPGIVKGTSVYQETFTLTGPATLSKTLDISGYSVKMSRMPGDYNKIPINYTLILNYNGIPPTGQEQIQVLGEFTDWKFSRFYGYVGQQSIATGLDSVFVKLFNNVYGGYFAATNPKITLGFDNSFGFPVTVSITKMEANNVNTGITTPIIYSNFQATFPINYPNPNQVGQSILTTRTLNQTNSNVDSLITTTPKYLFAGFEGISNPAGVPSNSNRNFMLSSSRININTHLEIPLEGFAYGIGVIDTLDFNFSERRDDVDWVEFKISIDNGFPFDLKMQLIFLDQNYMVLDSLLPNNDNIINSGVVGANGKVATHTKKITSVKYDQARVQHLYNAKYVIVKGVTNTYKASSSNPANQSIKIFYDYNVTVKAGIKINARPAKS
jgi:hypothetical protein